MAGCELAVETITACQNVCQDFSWITSLTEWASNLAIVVGVIIAGRQLNTWKKETRAKKRAEAAEALITAAAEVDVALRYIRNPWGQSPPDDDPDPFSYQWRERLARVQERKEDFEKLRHAQVRAKAFVGNTLVDSAVSDLMEVRQDVWAALGSLAAMQVGAEDRDQELRAFYEGLRWKVWGTYSDRDSVGAKQSKAMETLENELYPIIRLEG